MCERCVAMELTSSLLEDIQNSREAGCDPLGVLSFLVGYLGTLAMQRVKESLADNPFAAMRCISLLQNGKALGHLAIAHTAAAETEEPKPEPEPEPSAAPVVEAPPPPKKHKLRRKRKHHAPS